MTTRGLFKYFVAGLLLVGALASQGQPVFFYNDPGSARAAFHAAVGSPLALESFESGFGGTSVAFPIDGPTVFTATVSDGTIAQDSINPRGTTDGLHSMTVSENFPQLRLTFAFTSPIHAFGLDVNDLNFVSMSFADNLGNQLSNVLLGDNGGPQGGPSWQNLQFFGVVNQTPFSTVQLTFSNPSGLTGLIFLDRLEYAAVPEPSTLTLMSLGIIGVAFSRKRG